MEIIDLLLREMCAREGLSTSEAIELMPENAQQIDSIYDFFVSIGWIPEQNSYQLQVKKNKFNIFYYLFSPLHIYLNSQDLLI